MQFCFWDDVLQSNNITTNVRDFFGDFAVSVLIDDEESNNGIYGIKDVEINVAPTKLHTTFPIKETKEVNMLPFSIRFIEMNDTSIDKNIMKLEFDGGGQRYGRATWYHP